MNRKKFRRRRQQSLGLDPDDACPQLSSSAREECRELLTQMLIQVVQLERTAEGEDERKD